MPNNLDAWLAPKQKFIDAVRSLINFNLMNDEQIFAEYDEINYYASCINQENYYKWNKFNIISLADQFAVGPGGHLLEEGHEYISNLIYNYLQCLK
jgi:hypothetical protein